MVEKTGIKEIYQTIKSEYFEKMGIEDDLLLSILSYRLLIERVGEKKNNSWWDSRILDSFGRRSLEEVVDRSVMKSQLKLAQKTGRRVEKEIISSVLDGNKEYISLFNLGPYVENRLTNILNDLSVESDLRLKDLEELKISIEETGWSEGLVDFTVNEYDVEDNTILLGQVSQLELESDEKIKEIVEKMVYCYGESTKGDLKVPYYEVKHE